MSSECGKLPSQLSAGQQQRVAISRAMINSPRLLICDEPTSAIDNKMSTAVMRILREISRRKDRAVVVVSHDYRTRSAADRLATMEDGRIVKVE
jgi:putative ABC transport system ATP-binding protein